MLEQRLNMVERMILEEQDPKNWPYLNHTFQKLLDEQVRRDLKKAEQSPKIP